VANYRVTAERSFRAPVLVMALEGWVDSGAGAATAISSLLGNRSTEVLVIFDNDAYLDYRARRPILHISDGMNKGLTWSQIVLRSGTDNAGHDMLFLVGPEPDARWQEFCASVVELARGYGVRLMVGLGAFPAPVPHTRPVQLVSTATTEELARQVGFFPGTLDVPSGIQGALESAFAEAGIPAVGLWARIPHYLQAMPYPAAAAALVDGLAAVAGLSLESGDLHEAAARSRAQVDRLIADADEQAKALVHQLESQVDDPVVRPERGLAPNPLPTGDEIAAELQRFLRQAGEQGAPGPGE